MTVTSSAMPPDAIRVYLTSHDVRDTAVSLACFTPSARVTDDGRVYDGAAEIEGWLSTAASEYTYSRTFVSSTEVAPSRWLVVNRLEGNFPGNTVELRYEFELDGDLIAGLTIAP